MDWDDLRVFLQVARSGQMSAAARLLGIDHSTISRRIARLERQVGASLFDRAARRIRITDNGMRLLTAAEAMEAVLLRDVATIAGDGGDVSGCVRIGTSEGFGVFYLAPRLMALTRDAPNLEIELAALPRTFSLAAREVDLAVTMDRPETGNLRYKKLTAFDLGLYATDAYLERYGKPTDVSDLHRHVVCGYIKELLFTDELDLLTLGDTVLAPRFRTTSISAQVQAIISGSMIGMLPIYIANQFSNVKRLMPTSVSISRDYWISIHDDATRVPRVRFVMEAIESAVEADRVCFRAPKQP